MILHMLVALFLSNVVAFTTAFPSPIPTKNVVQLPHIQSKLQFPIHIPSHRRRCNHLDAHNNDEDGSPIKNNHDGGTTISTTRTANQKSKSCKCYSNRRHFLTKPGSKAIALSSLLVSSNPSPAKASTQKSRTEGYPIQRTEREWAYILSGPQYNILRNGGTERPNSSILEAEERPGTFACAACQTPLFTSQAKFHSGTGWPSFASTIGNNVEVEQVNPLQANLVGAELRCASCGGHLGDVFNDGLLFVNTPAFVTGKRYCIDGAALIFTPETISGDGANVEVVYGDTPPPSNKRDALPGFLQSPTITPR